MSEFDKEFEKTFEEFMSYMLTDEKDTKPRTGKPVSSKNTQPSVGLFGIIIAVTVFAICFWLIILAFRTGSPGVAWLIILILLVAVTKKSK